MSLYIITNLIFIFENCEFNILSWILHPYNGGKKYTAQHYLNLKLKVLWCFGCQMLVEHICLWLLCRKPVRNNIIQPLIITLRPNFLQLQKQLFLVNSPELFGFGLVFASNAETFQHFLNVTKLFKCISGPLYMLMIIIRLVN